MNWYPMAERDQARWSQFIQYTPPVVVVAVSSQARPRADASGAGSRERCALGRVGMLSKKLTGATAVLLALLTVSCSRLMPWRDEPAATEVNLAFTLERNLIELQTVRINERPGRFLFASAAPRTILDAGFAGNGPHVLRLTDKETIPISPATLDLRGVAEGIIGVEPWRNRSISIDYRSGLVTFQKYPLQPGFMTIYRYEHEPTIYVNVDGVDVAATVDTMSPDTLTLPAPASRRGTAHVRVAATDFGVIDIGYADVGKARVGNRLLSKFLVTIDYRSRSVGLWRDPRIPLS